MHIVLYEPEIPPNTGNIIRLCVNLGARLHLIQPLGFSLDNKQLRRAGLDYRQRAVIEQWPDLATWQTEFAHTRVLACSTRGTIRYDQIAYRQDDALLFGPETRGLPQVLIDGADASLRIPMRPSNRSVNLSNAVAVIAYEAWRQLDFCNYAARIPAASS